MTNRTRFAVLFATALLIMSVFTSPASATSFTITLGGYSHYGGQHDHERRHHHRPHQYYRHHHRPHRYYRQHNYYAPSYQKHGNHGYGQYRRPCQNVIRYLYDAYGNRIRVISTLCYDRYGNGYFVNGGP